MKKEWYLLFAFVCFFYLVKFVKIIFKITPSTLWYKVGEIYE